MYKNFNLTESEKEEILNKHKAHGYKKPLKEEEDDELGTGGIMCRPISGYFSMSGNGGYFSVDFAFDSDAGNEMIASCHINTPEGNIEVTDDNSYVDLDPELLEIAKQEFIKLCRLDADGKFGWNIGGTFSIGKWEGGGIKFIDDNNIEFDWSH
jgi:hypothetical protein